MIGTWLEASRWVYNLAVEVLQHGIPGYDGILPAW